MASRLLLHEYFKTLTQNVYFQPPTGTVMKYPAIRYTMTGVDQIYADDGHYHNEKCYEVIVIDRNPESSITNELLGLSMCSYVRHYAADGLNHDVFKIYW